jgi:TolB-like protein
MRTFLCAPLIRFVLGMYCLFLAAPAALSQQKSMKKLNVAVMDFNARGGITAEEAATLSDVFQSRLSQFKELTLIDRNRIKAILQEQGFQQSEACSQVECLVEAGKILKVEKMFAGSIGKVGKMFNVTVQLIDVQTSQILQTKSKQHSGDIEELVSDIVPNMADELAGELTGNTEIADSRGGGSSWLWYVLGGVAVAGGAAVAVLAGGGGDGGTTPPSTTTALPDSPSFP